MSTIPTWLQQHLEAIGAWNADGVTRRATARRCRSCRAPTLAGLDHHAAALPVRCDPTPLNALGELQALMAGHSTYRLAWLIDHYELDYRSHFDIRAHPAGTDKQSEVIREHKCGAAIPASYIGSDMTPPASTKGINNDSPPF
jgi:hypothetical protein